MNVVAKRLLLFSVILSVLSLSLTGHSIRLILSEIEQRRVDKALLEASRTRDQALVKALLAQGANPYLYLYDVEVDMPQVAAAVATAGSLIPMLNTNFKMPERVGLIGFFHLRLIKKDPKELLLKVASNLPKYVWLSDLNYLIDAGWPQLICPSRTELLATKEYLVGHLGS